MNISREVRDIAKELLERYKKEIEDSGHKASGNLQNSTKYQCTINGSILEVSFILPEYWAYLENGTRPHFPPVSALEDWIRVKKIIPSSASGLVPTTRQLAYVMARSISIHGTKPTKILQKTIDSSDDLVDRLIEELATQLQEQLNENDLI